MAFETFDLSLAPPGKMTMPYIVGGAIETGRSLSGLANSIDVTGGGYVAVKYSSIQLLNITRNKQLYWSRMASILSGGIRSVLVPLIVDFINPPGGFVELLAPAGLNASTLYVRRIQYTTDPPFMGGEWFEIAHPTLSSRAYVVTDTSAPSPEGNGVLDYTLNIRPPLREAMPIGTTLNFLRPKCLMRLAPGTDMKADVDPGFLSTPDVSFIESFGKV